MTDSIAAREPEMIELMDYSIDVAARNNGALIEKNKVIPGLVLTALGYDSPTISALEIALANERPDGYGEEGHEKLTQDRNMYEARLKCEQGVKHFQPFLLKGERVEYSKETHKRLLHDETFAKYLYACINAMKQADNIKIKWEKAAEKNSVDGSESSSPDATEKAA